MHLVASLRNAVEPEIPRSIRRRLLNGAAGRCREHDLRIREHGAGGIDRHAGDRLSRRRTLGVCGRRLRDEYREHRDHCRDAKHGRWIIRFGP